MQDALVEYIVIRSMQELEGFTVEEAKLTYKQRKKLPNSAFCGPSRTYPAHDKAHIQAGLQRLSQFKGSMKPATAKRIFACLSRKAKRLGVEISENVKKKLSKKGKKVEESLEWNDNAWIAWLFKVKGL